MLGNEIIEKFQRDGYLNLSRQIFLNYSIDKVFDFFSDAGNLDILTPKWLNFNILTDMPISISKGTQIEYKLKYRGVPIRWTSNINEWEPPYFFIDEQIKGPYRKWIWIEFLIIGLKRSGQFFLKTNKEYLSLLVYRLLVRCYPHGYSRICKSESVQSLSSEGYLVN